MPNFAWTSCNSFVSQHNLGDWHWQVTGLDRDGHVIAVSEERPLRFGSCLLADGRTGCSAPASPAPPPTAEPAATSCGLSSATSPVTVDGLLSPGEWDDAAVFGPVTVELGTVATTATVYVRPDPGDLLIGVRFDRDLSSLAVHTVAVRLDASPVDGSWNAGGAGTATMASS